MSDTIPCPRCGLGVANGSRCECGINVGRGPATFTFGNGTVCEGLAIITFETTPDGLKEVVRHEVSQTRRIDP